MRFLVDAQLPKRLAQRLVEAGHDARHTGDLPDGNASTDMSIINAAKAEQRVVITRDADFLNSYLIRAEPEKLLLISTGNISNKELEAILMPCLQSIVEGFAEATFLELTRHALILHR